MSDSHVYLITGGTGSLGTALTLHLLAQGHKVRAYARNEHSHERLEKLVPKDQRCHLSSLIGAVEDSVRLGLACRGCTHVVHAAAQKIIPLAEYNPQECVRTNIHGTSSVIRAALECDTLQSAVLVSSDKARAPNTLYGATKLVAERLWLQANKYRGEQAGLFRAVAYGNVWGSRGSVLHAFIDQALVGNLSLTDPEMTRFNITMPEAVSFVLDALHHAEPGTLWIPKLPSYKLGDLAKAFMRVYPTLKEPMVIGRRPSEKLHEDLISENESCSVQPDSQTSHYVMKPGSVYGKGGWTYNSGSNPHRLGIEALEKEIREWAK